MIKARPWISKGNSIAKVATATGQILLLILLINLVTIVGLAQAKIGSNISDGHIKILKWDETVYINPNSRRNVIKMTGRAEQVKANTYIKNWIYSITDSAVQQGQASFVIEYATVNGKQAVFIPSNGSISIDVDKAVNGKTLNIEFAYQVINRQEQPFYRVEQLFFGGFLVDTTVKYTVIIDRNLIMCSVPEYFSTADHYIYQWQGKVTPEMRNQSFHVTRAYGLWSIRTGFAISGLEIPTKFLEIRTPRLFNEGSQVIMSNKITPSSRPTLATNKDAYYLFQFKNLQTTELSLIMETTINNTKHLGSSAGYSTNDYGSLSSADRLLLDQAVAEIRRQHTERMNSGSNVPLFVSAGEWVHNYLTYDLQYVGKNTDLKSIMQIKRGVCEHYAILFTAICRALNMSAFHVSGFAYSETDKKFIGHAWNFVYSNGKWYEVDPTWNLMSGVVPLSHIIFQKGENKETQFRSTSEADYTIERITDIQYLGEKEGQLNPKELAVENNVQKTPGPTQYIPKPANSPTSNRSIQSNNSTITKPAVNPQTSDQSNQGLQQDPIPTSRLPVVPTNPPVTPQLQNTINQAEPTEFVPTSSATHREPVHNMDRYNREQYDNRVQERNMEQYSNGEYNKINERPGLPTPVPDISAGSNHSNQNNAQLNVNRALPTASPPIPPSPETNYIIYQAE